MTLYKKQVVHQDADETIKYTKYWGAALDDGDAISSVTNTGSGVTVSGETNDTTTTTYFASGVSGAAGYVTTEVTTSGGETLSETIYFEERTA